jgi:hypothetical protein
MSNLSPKAQELKTFFKERYSYVETPDNDLFEQYATQYLLGVNVMSIERAADFLYDYCLSSGNYEVQE